MHVLLLNQYFPPDTSATAKQAATVVEALAARHRVTVLCGRPSYDPTERYPWRLYRSEARNNVSIIRTGSTTYPRFVMRRRVANYLTYSSLATIRALGLRPDVVVAMTDPPFNGILAARIASLLRRPFVYNIRDLYPDMALGGGIVQPSSWMRRWENMHRRTLRQASRVVVLGEDMRARIVAKGAEASQVVVVRDGVDVSAAVPPATSNGAVREIRCGFPFALIHAGNLGFYGAWHTLIKAANLLQGDGIGLVFVGDGAQRSAIQATVNGTANVRFLPFRPASEIPAVLGAADVHVITIRRGLEGVVVPSKLYPILAAGKPVLAVAPQETDVAQIVRRENCGLVADPDDPVAVADVAREMARNPERVAEMGRRARAAAPAFDKAKQLQLFVETVEEAVATHRFQDSTRVGAERAAY